jgi:hypothetical protein
LKLSDISRTKKKEYLKAEIEGLGTNSKIKNITDLFRSISDFKKGYQPRTNIVKHDKGDLVADSLTILARWRNHFSQLLNIHGVNNGRQTEIVHTAVPLVPEPSAYEIKLAIEKLQSHKSHIDQIPAEVIKAGAEKFAMRFVNILFLFGIRRSCLRSGRS